MLVNINGKTQEIQNGITLAELLAQKELRPEMLTVELNQNILPRESFPDTRLSPGDSLELIFFMGGGGREG
jgi:thiamine biosynthesis protein ThiS